MNMTDHSLGVWHCYTRGVYFYSYVYWSWSMGGTYVVDDYGSLVRVGE